MIIMCRKCQDVFEIPTRRGRPPAFCGSCREQKPIATIKPPKSVITIKPKSVGIKLPPKPTGNIMTLFCQGCQDVFSFPARAGRPPKYCSKCAVESHVIEDTASRERANARVDRLMDMMLNRTRYGRMQHG